MNSISNSFQLSYHVLSCMYLKSKSPWQPRHLSIICHLASSQNAAILSDFSWVLQSYKWSTQIPHDFRVYDWPNNGYGPIWTSIRLDNGRKMLPLIIVGPWTSLPYHGIQKLPVDKLGTPIFQGHDAKGRVPGGFNLAKTYSELHLPSLYL